MSIWCTILDFSADDHAEDCARWIPCAPGDPVPSGRARYGDKGMWRYDDGVDCSCSAGPLGYRKSHVIPAPSDQRAGLFDLASIAAHIGPDHEYRDEDGTHQPYLRVGLRGSAEEPDVVVLDREQVQELHQVTGWWLEHCDPTGEVSA